MGELKSHDNTTQFGSDRWSMCLCVHESVYSMFVKVFVCLFKVHQLKISSMFCVVRCVIENSESAEVNTEQVESKAFI